MSGTLDAYIANELSVLRAALVETSTLDALPSYTELVQGLLIADSLAWLSGKPGSGKSFLALDVAARVATGTPWHGRTTKKGRVLYVLGEGGSGLKARVRAWEIARDLLMYGVWFLPRAVQMLDTVQGPAFAMLCAELQPALIVIDTQARVTVGINENSAEEMGRFVDALDGIRTATNACVLLVHHETHEGARMRGSTALSGAAQTIIRCSREQGFVTAEVTKQKDGDPGSRMEFQMVDAGLSVVLEPVSRGGGNFDFRGHELMRAISDYLAQAGDSQSLRAIRAAVPGSNEAVGQALAQLVQQGFVATSTGVRGAVMHTLLLPYGRPALVH